MSQEKVDLEPKWYVIHTYSGYENKVKADLEKKVKNQEMEEYFFEQQNKTPSQIRETLRENAREGLTCLLYTSPSPRD